ncbi:MAG: hypothetical protein GYA16_01155, partial [Spirochaetes bacterium]|nr:hypothetical protein [Spirochaetota bacterium]
MLLDVLSIKGQSLEYSVFIYDEEGIPLPYASQKYETDMSLFKPLILYKDAQNQSRNFRYINPAELENKEWLAIKVSVEEAKDSVFIILTDNAVLSRISVINSSDDNITHIIESKDVIISNTYRKLVLDLSGIEDKSGSFTLYLGLVGNIGYGVNVYKQKTSQYVYIQEYVFLLLGLWFGIMLMILARIARFVKLLRKPLVVAFAFCVLYVCVYFVNLVVRTGILQVTSIALLSVENIVVLFHSVFAFSLFCLFLENKLEKEWYYSGAICLTILILLSVSGYGFVSEILVNIFNILVFLVLLYNLQHFKFKTDIVRKFALAMVIFVILFSFLNVSIMLVSKMYSFSYRFVHLGIFISILLLIQMSYEQQLHEASMVEAESAKKDFEERNSNLEQVYKNRLGVVQKLLNKPVSEICMMLDEFREAIQDENIKRYISVWKMELSKYLSLIPSSSDFEAA